MDLKDLEKLHLQVNQTNQLAELDKLSSRNKQFEKLAKLRHNMVTSNAQYTEDFASSMHEIQAREKAERIDREQQLIDLLGGILQSNRDSDKKNDIMLFVVIITCVLTFIGLVFLR